MKNKLLAKKLTVLFAFGLMTILTYRMSYMPGFEESSSSLIIGSILMMILAGFIPTFLQNGQKRNFALPVLGIVTGAILDSIYYWVCRGIERNLIGLEIIMLVFILGPLIAIVFFFANSAFLSKSKHQEVSLHDRGC